MNRDTQHVVEKIVQEDSRYPVEAYGFVLDVVNIVSRALIETGKCGVHPEISGMLLSESMRRVLLTRFGIMAIDVLDKWNVHKTQDFGNLVFNLVKYKLLGTNPGDDISDFADVFDFYEAFVKPFQASGPKLPLPTF